MVRVHDVINDLPEIIQQLFSKINICYSYFLENYVIKCTFLHEYFNKQLPLYERNNHVTMFLLK